MLLGLVNYQVLAPPLAIGEEKFVMSAQFVNKPPDPDLLPSTAYLNTTFGLDVRHTG